jgi:hypothetical protein
MLMPALLINTSILPNASTVFLTKFSQSLTTLTSVTTEIASALYCLTSDRTASNFSELRAAKATLLPFFENSIASALPIPDDAPVIITTFPFILSLFLQN